MRFLTLLCLFFGKTTAQNFECPGEKVNLTSTVGTAACASSSGPSCQKPVADSCIFKIENYGLNSATQVAQVIVYAGNLNPRDRITIFDLRTGDSIGYNANHFGNETSSTYELNVAFPLDCPANTGHDFLTISIAPDATGTNMTFGYYVQIQNVPSIQGTTQLSVTNPPQSIGNSVKQKLTLRAEAQMDCPSEPQDLQSSLVIPQTAVQANFECSYSHAWDGGDFAFIETISVYGLSDTDVVQLQGVYDTVTVSPDNTLDGSKSYWNQQSLSFGGEHFIFYVKTGPETSLSFEYTLKRQTLNLAATPTNVAFPSVLSPSNDAYYIMTRDGKAGATWRFTFEDPKVNHELNVVAIAPADNYALQLTNFAVYDAADTSTCLGTLYSPFSNPKVFTATNGIVIYQIVPLNWDGVILVNDQRNLAGCNDYSAIFPYSVVNGVNTVNSGNVVVKATATGGTCLTIFNYYDGSSPIVTSWSTAGAASPLAIAGAPVANASMSGDRILAQFDNTSFTLPQIFNGISRTFYVDKGTTFTFTMGMNVTSTNLYQAPIGRKGFINTKNYPFYSESQEGRLEFESTESFELTLHIPQRTYDSESVLTMMIVGSLLHNVMLAEADPSYRLVGNDIVVGLTCPNSNGAYITYEIGPVETSSTATTQTASQTPGSGTKVTTVTPGTGTKGTTVTPGTGSKATTVPTGAETKEPETRVTTVSSGTGTKATSPPTTTPKNSPKASELFAVIISLSIFLL